MKYIKSLSVLFCMLSSLSLYSNIRIDEKDAYLFERFNVRVDDYRRSSDFSGSVDRVLSTQKPSKIAVEYACSKKAQSEFSHHSYYEIMLDACLDKNKYEAALNCLGAKTQEEKDAIIEQAQVNARECAERLHKFRKAFQVYNLGDTEAGARMLDKLASKYFEV